MTTERKRSIRILTSDDGERCAINCPYIDGDFCTVDALMLRLDLGHGEYVRTRECVEETT